MLRLARGIHQRKLAAQHIQRCLLGSLQDDEEMKRLRSLFMTRSMMPIQRTDIEEFEDKLSKGSMTPSVFSESVRQLMVSGRYKLALDMYENLISTKEETNRIYSTSVLNDATLLMLVHCYSSTGKMGPFIQMCADLRDKRKYTPLLVERMVICFARLDRLDMVEALLIEWLGRNLNMDGVMGRKDDDIAASDWNDVLRKTLQDENREDSWQGGNHESHLRNFMVPLLERTSPKLGKRSKRAFLSSSKAAQFTNNLLDNLDAGTLSYNLPSLDMWKSVVRMYADRTAWLQCMQISAVCFSLESHDSSNAAPREGEGTMDDDQVLIGIVHHTIRALCRSGQYLKALNYLQSSQKKLGRRLRKAPTLALFLSYFHSHGNPAALQTVLDGVLDLIEEYLTQSDEGSSADGDSVREVELRGLISGLVSLLCRRGYVIEAMTVTEKLVESLSLSKDLSVSSNARILRPSVLSNLINAFAMRDDERAIALFHSLKFREGPLGRALSGDGYHEAVDSAYHSLMGREKFLGHLSSFASGRAE